MIFGIAITLSTSAAFVVCRILLGILSRATQREMKKQLNGMALASVGLALATGFVANLELEMGVMSLPLQVIALSIVWSLLVFVCVVLIKKFANRVGQIE